MRPFKAYRYAVNKELLMRWRAAGEGTNKIAARYGCDQSTVRNWLIRFGLPTQMETQKRSRSDWVGLSRQKKQLIEPLDIPPGEVALPSSKRPRDRQSTMINRPDTIHSEQS